MPFDAAEYARRVARGCFICRMLAGDVGYEHEVVLQDSEHVAFLNRWPSTRGQLIVAPLRHVQHLTGDLDEEAYVRLQRIVHRAATALRSVVPTERIYTASLGSNQGNDHVHIHVAALPPNTPPAMQQFAALDVTRAGVLALPPEDTRRIAAALRHELGSG